MGLLGRVFGTKEALGYVSNHLDKVFFTKEEKAQNWIDTLKAYEPFKLAQRLVALSVTGTYLFVFLVAIFMKIASCWGGQHLNEMSDELIQQNNETLGTAFICIVSFYFAGGMAEGILSKLRKKS